MQLLAHLLYWYSTHALYCLPVLLPLVFVGLWATRRWPRPGPSWLVAVPLGLVGLSLLMTLVGSWPAAWLVYRAGQNGRGEVISSYGTGTVYNSHHVVGYRVLLRTQAGQTVRSSFEDDDFNVWPPANRVSYPGVGDQFTVRYLPDYPQDFLIVTNDGSPYGRQQSCAALLDSLHEARRVHEFDLGNADSKQAYVALIGRVLARHCYTDSTDRREYLGDLAHVQLEPCQALLDSLDTARDHYNANVADLAGDAAYLALIRRVVARPPCYTDSADRRKYYDDMRRVEKAQAEIRAGELSGTAR